MSGNARGGMLPWARWRGCASRAPPGRTEVDEVDAIDVEEGALTGDEGAYTGDEAVYTGEPASYTGDPPARGGGVPCPPPPDGSPYWGDPPCCIAQVSSEAQTTKAPQLAGLSPHVTSCKY